MPVPEFSRTPGERGRLALRGCALGVPAHGKHMPLHPARGLPRQSHLIPSQVIQPFSDYSFTDLPTCRFDLPACRDRIHVRFQHLDGSLSIPLGWMTESKGGCPQGDFAGSAQSRSYPQLRPSTATVPAYGAGRPRQEAFPGPNQPPRSQGNQNPPAGIDLLRIDARRWTYESGASSSETAVRGCVRPA